MTTEVQKIMDQQDAELNRLGLHTALKEMEIKDEATGKIEKQLVRMVVNPNPDTVEAFAMLMENPSDKIWDKINRVPGLKELRAEFDAAANNSEGSCTGCKRGALLKKYAPRVMVLLKKYEESADSKREDALDEYVRMTGLQAERPTPQKSRSSITTNDTEPKQDSRPEPVSAPGAASPTRTERRKTMLRRAAEGIAKVFRKSKTAG